MSHSIIHKSEQRKFVLEQEGYTSWVEYKPFIQGLNIVHTYVPEPLRGRGVADRLVKYVLDHARSQGLSIRATCSYVAAYIERHKEYIDLQSNSECVSGSFAELRRD